jgi:outer membrane protein OmpA-like peptidoglycan-associated protein
LNDLLPKGRQEVLNVASQISTGFVSVRQIKLVGHTDRLGSDSYNNQLGQNRADTVRSLLVQNGIAGNVISTASAGKQQPVTDGCFNVKQREALKACLQPDRRVSVEITGIAK